MLHIIWLDLPKAVSNFVIITFIIGACLYFLYRCYFHIENKEADILKLKYKASYAAAIMTFLAIINGILAVVLIFFTSETFPRTENEFDYLGLLVGILGGLITIVLAWQIFTTIAIEKKIDKKVNHRACSIEQNINDTREAATALSLYHLSCAEYILNEKDYALWLALDAMTHCSKIKKIGHDFQKECYFDLIQLIEELLPCLERRDMFCQQDINNFKEAAEHLNQVSILRLIEENCIPNPNAHSANYRNRTGEYLNRPLRGNANTLNV